MSLSAKILTGLLVLSALAAAPAQAQAARDLTEIGLDLYQRANAPDALAKMRKDLVNAPEAYLVSKDQPGTLVLLNKRRVQVPVMKYNVALRLLEVRDSTGSHVWPPGSLDGFYLGKGGDARHFRSLPVRIGSTRTDFVEVLTPTDDSPIVLGLQNHYLHEDAQVDPILRTETKAARTGIGQMVVAGPGNNPKEPLRELALNQRSVAKLFGTSAPQIEAYAVKEHLTYTALPDVLHLVEYYNRHVGKP